jgi:hypothetical protein
MASMDGYDYSGMSHFIEEFQNPFTDKPFISEMEENYGSLWKRGYCASVECGAGSGDFESGERELLLEFYKYRNSTKNRNFDGYFFQKFYFW